MCRRLTGGLCASAGVRGRQPHPEELEGHRHLPAGHRGGLLTHHHVRGGAHAWYVSPSPPCGGAVTGHHFDWTLLLFVVPVELPGSSRSRLTVNDLLKPELSIHHPGATWISSE